MSKAKTNALDALRALIAERQQYEQWISALDLKREGTPEHVFERVQGDYRGRLDKVVTDIKGYAEELQLSISTLSSRLVEVARDEDTRREGLQEAELRAAVGEYEPQQWDELRREAEQSLEKIVADRVSLDSQLSELRSIQKLSEAGAVGDVGATPGFRATPPELMLSSAPEAVRREQITPLVESSPPEPVWTAALPSSDSGEESAPPPTPVADAAPQAAAPAPEPAPTPAPDSPPMEPTRGNGPPSASRATPSQDRPPLDSVSAVASGTGRGRSSKTPAGGAPRSRSEPSKPDQAKTLKCPECGTPNHPTEWYCERCGGELATM